MIKCSVGVGYFDEVDCGRNAIGVTDNGVYVCAEHGAGREWRPIVPDLVAMIDVITGNPEEFVTLTQKRSDRMVSKTVKAVLIHEWTDDSVQYRMVTRSDHTQGYEDNLIVETLGQDAIGEPRWDVVMHLRVNKEDSKTRKMSESEKILFSAIKSLRREYK